MRGYWIEYSQSEYVTDVRETAFERHHALVSKDRLLAALSDSLVTIWSAQYVIDAEQWAEQHDCDLID